MMGKVRWKVMVKVIYGKEGYCEPKTVRTNCFETDLGGIQQVCFL